MRIRFLPAPILALCLACPIPALAVAPGADADGIQTPDNNATLRDLQTRDETARAATVPSSRPEAAPQPPKKTGHPKARYGDIIIYQGP
ncbi:MAG: hypothetical protein AB7D57_05535 [Desulfovibrionaceae bacterium]